MERAVAPGTGPGGKDTRDHAGRIQHTLFHVLFFEQPQPGLTLKVRRPDGLGLIVLLRAAGGHLLQHLLERTRTVGHVKAQALFAVEDPDLPVGQNDLRSIGQLHRRDGTTPELIWQVAGEGVPGLVAMGIAVEQPILDVTHVFFPPIRRGR